MTPITDYKFPFGSRSKITPPADETDPRFLRPRDYAWLGVLLAMAAAFCGALTYLLSLL